MKKEVKNFNRNNNAENMQDKPELREFRVNLNRAGDIYITTRFTNKAGEDARTGQETVKLTGTKEEIVQMLADVANSVYRASCEYNDNGYWRMRGMKRVVMSGSYEVTVESAKGVTKLTFARYEDSMEPTKIGTVEFDTTGYARFSQKVRTFVLNNNLCDMDEFYAMSKMTKEY